MTRSIRACLAAAAFALFAASAAVAAPKEAAKGEEKVCAAGVGTAVCCKASVANHCGYASCCEMGNSAFFSKTSCATCRKHDNQAKAAHHKSHAGSACGTNGYVSCCEEGNGGFFKGNSCCGHKAAAGASCCAAPAAKKAEEKK
jgi:hypothetical protein